ncbi:MAG: branched-chain-amino-acid transaminase [Opitutales bacterium]|nr:branched-chain-amino-acid transaminase [Opitutales bacterium]
MKVYLTDRFVEQEDAKISVFDHGLLYGDGIFEGIRLYDGCVFKLDAHLERLEMSARAIMLQLPWSRQEISDLLCESCRVNGLKNGYIRLVVTRGVGTLGLNPLTCHNPQLIIIADNIVLYPAEYYQNGLKIVTSPTRRNNQAALPPMIKSLNYLNNVLAKIDALNMGAFEAIMLNDRGMVAECTGDNLFIVHKGTIYTPPVNSGSLDGITRAAIFEIAAELNIPIVERELTRYEIWIADECFLTGTAAEVIPVVELDKRPIGEGKPGPVTKRLLELFQRNVAKDGTMI